MTLTDAEQRFLVRHARGHLATVGPDGIPQVKPLGFSYNTALGTIDITGWNMANSAKYRNVRSNPRVAFVVDEVTAPTMEGAHFLEIRGDAETAAGTHDLDGHLAPEIIRIRPRRVVGFKRHHIPRRRLRYQRPPHRVPAHSEPAGNRPDRHLLRPGAAGESPPNPPR